MTQRWQRYQVAGDGVHGTEIGGELRRGGFG